MDQRQVVSPSAKELQEYSVGKCAPHRAVDIESFLAGGPDCGSILDAAPEDALIFHLRGAGELPRVDEPPELSATFPGSGGSVTRRETAGPGLGADASVLLEHPRYRLIRKLGQGGMGTVYLAEHRVMRRLVAVKLIHARYLNNPARVARFHQEVQAAACLSHPHIVTAYDADEAGGTHFLVMEFVEGESLAERLARLGPLPVLEASVYVRQVALGLQLAHQKGMVHRDIKPHNLMRTDDGTVKILDFGLARVLREAGGPECPLTTEGTVMGTADYIAPEQAKDSRNADIRADIYSLGCTLYHLLSGHVPFPGGTAIGKIIRHATLSPDRLGRCRADLPAGLAQVIDRMMAKKREDRYQTPAEVVAAIEPFTQQGSGNSAGTMADPLPVSSPHPARSRRWLAVLVLAAILLLIVGGVAFVAVYRNPTDADEPRRKAPGITDAKPARIELVRRIPVAAAADLFYDTAISKGGKYALVTKDIKPGVRMEVFNVASGELIFDCPGYKATFLNEEQIVVDADGLFRVYEASTGKVVREGRHRDFYGMIVAPGGKHLGYHGPKGAYLYDMVQMRDLHAWVGKLAAPLLFSPDGKRLLCRFEGGPWIGWDSEANGPAKDLGGLKGVTRVSYFCPDGRTAVVQRNGAFVRIDLGTGKVEGSLTFEPPTGAIDSMFSATWRRFAGRYPDGLFLFYRAPFSGKELGRFQLSADDRAVSPYRGGHSWSAFSEDDQYAALVTTRSLYILRLPTLPPEKSN